MSSTVVPRTEIDSAPIEATGSADAERPHRRRRRRARPTVSAPHVVMVIAGAVAGLATLAALRDDVPAAHFVVAAHDLAPGTPLASAEVELVVGHADERLLDDVVRADELADLQQLVLARVVAEGVPLRRGDLTQIRDESVPRTFGFSLPRARAVGGALVVGDRVDVLAVDAGGQHASYIATAVEVVAYDDGGSGPLGTSDDVVVTVAVDESTALSLASALERGSVSLVRSTGARREAIERPVDVRRRVASPGARS